MDSSVIFPELPTYVGAPSLAGVLSLALTVLLPLAAALFMRSSWSATKKGFVLLICAAIKAYLEGWLFAVDAHIAFNFATTAWSTIIQFGLAVIAYFGLLKNTSVQQAAIGGGIVRDKVIDGKAY